MSPSQGAPVQMPSEYSQAVTADVGVHSSSCRKGRAVRASPPVTPGSATCIYTTTDRRLPAVRRYLLGRHVVTRHGSPYACPVGVRLARSEVLAPLTRARAALCRESHLQASRCIRRLVRHERLHSVSDWAVKHSTTGWLFMLSQATVSWGSKKQVSMALSSCEAEIMAASDAAKEALYLRRFAAELGMTSK